MGLSIAYQLNLPAATPRAVVEERLVELRDCARCLPFTLVTDYQPAGDQLSAIAELVEGIRDNGEVSQVLLGVTGSG